MRARIICKLEIWLPPPKSELNADDPVVAALLLAEVLCVCAMSLLTPLLPFTESVII
jgi:hypothetical protein